MTEDAFERVLRLVSEGRLTAEEAGPILDSLDAARGKPSRPAGQPPESPAGDSAARAIRVQITDRGRTVVNLRVPLSLGRAAITRVPGISELTSERIREAIAAGIKGPIIDIDDEGDRVQISIE
jgi:hypothetical protein